MEKDGGNNYITNNITERRPLAWTNYKCASNAVLWTLRLNDKGPLDQRYLGDWRYLVRNLSTVGREIKTKENSQSGIRDVQRTRGPNEAKERV